MHSYSIGTSLLSNLRSLVLFWLPFLLHTHLARCHSNEHWKARRPHDSGRFSIQFRIENSFHFTPRLTLNHLRFSHAINTRLKPIPSASSTTECARLSVGPVPHVQSQKSNAIFVRHAARAVLNAITNACMQTSL
jgi:hypothetical protein